MPKSRQKLGQQIFIKHNARPYNDHICNIQYQLITRSFLINLQNQIKIMDKKELVLKKAWLIANKTARIEDSYQFDSKALGTGAFGTVYKGRLKGQTSESAWRAIKKIPKRKVNDRSQFLNEIQILQKLDHPNIIKLYETFQDQKNIFMVTEMCTGGQLFDKIIDKGHFTQEQARVIFNQMLLALNYCHSQKVAHRDLKPENFLFLNKEKDSPIKLIDFGLSFRFSNEKKNASMKTLVGTSYYMAPEVMKGIYNERCDIWSAGVILYILITGVPPFNGQNDQDILQAVKKMKYTFNIPEMKGVSVGLKDLISNILVESSKRPTAEIILKHPWVTSGASNEPLKLNLIRMKAFVGFIKLKKVAVMMIATQLHQKDIAELGKVFKSVDKNNDGVLNLDQIRYAIEKQKQKPGMLQINKLLSQIDAEGSGSINYTEFIASCMQQAIFQREQNIRMVFKMMDINQDGRITKEELSKIFSKPEHEMDPKLLADMIKECDRNGDGVIDYNEFLEMMYKSSQHY